MSEQPSIASQTGTRLVGESSSQRVLPTSSLLALPVQSSFGDIALRYFTNELKINDPARVQLLIQAAHGFVKKPTLPYSSYEQLWSTKSDIFEQPKIGHISRTRRLHEGRRKIKQGSKEYNCAGRFSLLFLRHDIDETVVSLEDTALKHGQKKATVAYERIALDLSMTIGALREKKTHSQHYMSLLKRSDPGDLLKLGDGVSTL